MYSLVNDTIAARATPPGRGGVGIIRISGKETAKIAAAILGSLPTPRLATLGNFLNQDGSVIDQGIALFFKAPNSFTGEDVLELHGHGGTIILEEVLHRVLELGARMARPGEFSERAFLNNKIDLTQAEAIADLIEASSREAARSAVRSLQGKFSDEINKLVSQVINLRMYVEAAIDFPEEEVDFLSDGKIVSKLEELTSQLDHVLEQTRQGSVLREGMKVVITGYPNAGKSSLLNSLSGAETAIVSDEPGTTRDVVKENILIDGLPIYVLDTAGLRLATNAIEAEGVRRAWGEIPDADRILLVIEADSHSQKPLGDHPLLKQFIAYKDRLTIVRNKIDLSGEQPRHDDIDNIPIIHLSAKKGLGLALLKHHLKDCMGYQYNENVLIARRRHLDCLHAARLHFDEASRQLLTYKAGELVAEELRQAQNALNEITGEFSNDDLLGKIFSSFCIGK